MILTVDNYAFSTTARAAQLMPSASADALQMSDQSIRVHQITRRNFLKGYNMFYLLISLSQRKKRKTKLATTKVDM